MSGVPQGTLLGPLLFSLHINDIMSDIESEIRLFADDCVCYREIKEIEVILVPPWTFLSLVILVSGHSVPGHFGPCSFRLGTFWSLVISSPITFQSWVILVPGHFGPWDILIL